MSEMKTLSVEKRSGFGKGPNRRLRAEALVPGVYYAADGVNVPVQMPALPLSKIYEQVGRTNVFNLEIDDNGVKTTHPVFVWDAQYHPVKGVFTHVDFYGVDLDKEIKVEVPLEFTGVSKGVKLGGKRHLVRQASAYAPQGQRGYHEPGLGPLHQSFRTRPARRRACRVQIGLHRGGRGDRAGYGPGRRRVFRGVSPARVFPGGRGMF